MSKKTDLSSERETLRTELRKLETGALRGRDRTDAIAEANRRLRQAGLRQLSPTTVGGWFEKGTPAKDFTTLWTLVEVLLEWSGRPRPDTLTGPDRAEAMGRWTSTKELWKSRWEQARGSRPAGAAPNRLPAIGGYLAAIRRTAKSHPYPDAWDGTHLPGLTDVYVRQKAHQQTTTSHSGPEDATPARSPTAPEPAEEIFRTSSNVCVLLAPAGSGKSTLLRTHRADSAGRWLEGQTDTTVPVLVNADALNSADTLPAALAKAATSELRRFGLLDQLTADLFRHLPRPRTPWLVMVDGLDEIPDADTRRAVVQTIAETAAAQPALYRFVVATRPLPAGEISLLGQQAHRYELHAFTLDDLLTYATKWFTAMDDPRRHAQAFVTELQRSRLDTLARTPLIASMLCQLYAADPAHPLPDGRSGAYQSFVELIYEQNTHKHIRTTHDAAIHRLKDRHQIPKDNQAAEQAAQQVRDYLPELIDHLAHERINGNTAVAADILASHLHANRPQKVRKDLWRSFLSDLLRPTGLLAQRANDLDFLHQTLLEYHAARHATRDEQSRTQLLEALIASSRAGDRLEPPDLQTSYLGFLLDGLIAPHDHITARTNQYLTDLTAHGGTSACMFLSRQVELRTCLLPDLTAAQLKGFAEDSTLDGSSRVTAVQALAEVQGYQDDAVALFTAFTQDTTLDDLDRASAARSLAEVQGHRNDGVALLIGLVRDPALAYLNRVTAAELLAGVEGHRDDGAAELVRLSQDTTASFFFWVAPLEALAKVEGHRDEAVALLTAFVQDTAMEFAPSPTGGISLRVQAAEALAKVEGHRDDGAAQLLSLALDTTVTDLFRVQAAQALAGVEGHQADAVALLAALSRDPALHHLNREQAAQALARVDNVAALLTTLIQDPAKPDLFRIRAAWALAGVEGHRDDAVTLLTTLAQAPTQPDFIRIGAALVLAGVEGHRDDAVTLLTTLAQDPAQPGLLRVQAAWSWAGIEGHRDDAVTLLTTLAQDPAQPDFVRAGAAWVLNELGVGSE
ncbi:NACHT domain-containing protein [Streptomyces sp. C1-1]|uniref:NACHT domain-containing protein n=1 Tax=Streptomyces sp. C1-1 TaxID=3231173 RepID=UPI003D0433B4